MKNCLTAGRVPKIKIMLQNKRNIDGVPEGIRTPDLRFRKPLLYPAELPGRVLHYSRKACLRSSAISFLLLMLLIQPVWAEPCPPPAQQAPAVARIRERLDIELSDGRLIKLLHLAPFEATRRGAAQSAKAKTALEQWLGQDPLTLPARLPLADRWGRLATPAYTREGTDIGLTLIAQGLARVAPTRLDECVAPLLAAEAQARNAKLGLWADSHYAVLSANNPTALSAHRDEFVIAEGQVTRIGQNASRYYLDLGPARGSNLSVTFSRQDAKAFMDAGLAPDRLMGQMIRVRGILEHRPGPLMELFTPAAIEVIGLKP